MNENLAVIGVDSGNTKTIAVCATVQGDVIAMHRIGPSNYQTIGPDKARERLWEVVLPLAQAAVSAGVSVVAYGFGLTGLDRPKDAEVLDKITGAVMARAGQMGAGPDRPARQMLNDAFLSLRAGTVDGVGVAVSAGTSGNCVGMSMAQERLQVGGLAHELGDGGGAFDIAIAGLRAAGRSRDGRGWPTMIHDLVLGALGLQSLDDLMDFMIPGNEPPRVEGVPTDLERPLPLMVGFLAPLVFKAASMGDLVARRILTDLGADLGLSARIAATRLGFGRDETFPLVLGGSVLMHGEEPSFEDALVAEVRRDFPSARPVKLKTLPVMGALLLAFDELARRRDQSDLQMAIADGSLSSRLGPAISV